MFSDGNNDDDDNINDDDEADNEEKNPWGIATHTQEWEKEQQRDFSCNHCGTEFIVGVKLKRQNDPFCCPQMVLVIQIVRKLTFHLIQFQR